MANEAVRVVKASEPSGSQRHFSHWTAPSGCQWDKSQCLCLFIKPETKQRGNNCNPQYCVYSSISYCGSSPCSKVHRRSESTSPSALLTTLPVVPKCGLTRCKAVWLQVASLLWSHWEWPLFWGQRGQRGQQRFWEAYPHSGSSTGGRKSGHVGEWLSAGTRCPGCSALFQKQQIKAQGKNRVCLIKWH